MFFFLFFYLFSSVLLDDSYIDYKNKIPCDGVYKPDNCGYPNVTLDYIITVEDLDRCGPAVLPKNVRNYYWSAAGRKVTYERNFEALKREIIVPRALRDVSKNYLHTDLLGEKVELPIGISPTAVHKRANPIGEIGTARAAASVGAVMVFSCLSETRIEDVAKAAFSVNPKAILWMHIYLLKNRDEILQIIERAEYTGFKALVVNVDSPISTKHSCSSDEVLFSSRLVNLFDDTVTNDKLNSSVTFQDLAWLKTVTKLPIVAKGILTGDDAVQAAEAGAAAIFVSNQGGRQLEGSIATITVLPEVVRALHNYRPQVEVYMDGGVRNGWDVLKVLSKGAKAAFVGRPALWGLAIDGERGVQKMLKILRAEFNESMLVAGYPNPGEIHKRAIRELYRPAR